MASWLSHFILVKNHNMKKNKQVKISYDREADVLSWEADKNTPIDHAQEMGNLVVHFSNDKRPVLVEMLDASKHFRRNRRSITPLSMLLSTAK